MHLTQKILSDIAIFTKYAKHNEVLGRRETWDELVDRNKAMHKAKYPELAAEIDEVYDNYVRPKKVLPSMRSMQFAGRPIEINATRGYNCSFTPADSPEFFSELMFLLLSGTGVGYSVQRAHVEKLPEIRKPTKTRRYLIGDSIEGWSDSVKVLLSAYMKGKALPIFDFSDIRPKGARLVTSGGKAPGPEPLKDCLHNLQKVLDRKGDGEKLNSLEVHDMACYIADAVLAGGIRRAAMISLFDIDDEDMLTCKFGDWYVLNPQRARANNSAVVVRHKVTKDDFMGVWEKVKASGSGEPGFFMTNNTEYGTNPCITYDTLVGVADGRGYVEIGKLAEEGKDVPVYTIDNNGVIRASMMRHPRMTSEKSEILKITMDDGSVIRATPNHKFPLANGITKEAKDLEYGDTFITLTRFEQKGRNTDNMYVNLSSRGNVRAEHRVIAEYHQNVDLVGNSRELVVHHIDGDSQNNNPSNLQIMTPSEHNSMHMMGEGNAVHKVLNSDRRAEFIEKLSENSSAENNPNYSGFTHSDLENHALYLTKKLGRQAFHSDWVEYAEVQGLPKTFSGWRLTHLGGISGFLKKAAIDLGFVTYDGVDTRTVKRLHYYLSQGYDCFIEDGKLLFNKVCEFSGESFVTENPESSISPSKSAEYTWHTSRAAILNGIKSYHADRKSSIREEQAKVYNSLKFELGREPKAQEWKNACRKAGVSSEISRQSSPFRNYTALKEYASTSNHKVVSVEHDGYEAVYNGTVDETHTFFIGAFPSTKNKSNIASILTRNCGEISLRPYQFCNLTEVNVSDLVDQADYNARSKAAAFIGTLQAGYTNFHYLRDIWKKTTEKEALIGVGMTGIASGKVLELNMTEAAEVAKGENERVAKIIGINKAARCLTVKPSGTTSIVCGVSSGIHAWHDKFYVRRMRVNKNESIYNYLAFNHPELVEDDFFAPTKTAVISVPQKAPEGAITRDESALDLLARVKKVYNEWVKVGHRKGDNTNNVSVTVSIKDHEWDEVGEWMWENRNNYCGISVLPYSDHTYKQAPFETITEEEYERLVKTLHDVDLSKVVEVDDNTDLANELACASGNCEL